VTTALVVFLQGVSAAGAWAAGLFFLRFWRELRDRLFLFFGVAFWMMGLSWALLALIDPVQDRRPYIYGLRLVAFLLIIAGILDKNRKSR
jgi:hypothetical protein